MEFKLSNKNSFPGVIRSLISTVYSIGTVTSLNLVLYGKEI